MSSLKLVFSVFFFSAFILTGCGGGGDTKTDTSTDTISSSVSLTSFELIDPTPGAGDNFGENIFILANGNIIISEPKDSSVATKNGAVHLYNPFTQTRIASFYGVMANDQLGSGGITVLTNNNFIITSELDDENGIINAGSVMLVDGTTGLQIGNTLTGETANDKLGQGGTIALANNNYVVVSPEDDENGQVNAGSVRLFDGSTGNQISLLVGDLANDDLGNFGVTALTNNNYVISSPNDDDATNSNVDAGSVRLVNGESGAQINILVGETAGDRLGYGKITILANNNYVISSPYDDDETNSIVDAGSVKLVNGATGIQIGNSLMGETLRDWLGFGGITVLANNNYVIASPYDNDETNSIVDAGSVKLVNGSNGELISTLWGKAGDTPAHFLKSSSITALRNNHYVIASPYDDVPGITNAGSVKLMNGSTGTQIGSAIAGDEINDRIGSGGITTLANNNYVIASPLDDEGVITNAGSVRLMDGSKGVQIGATLVGDIAEDQIGETSVTALANNNYVVASLFDDENDIVNAGSVRLMDGTSATTTDQISLLSGDTKDDFLGFVGGGNPGVIALANSDFVIASKKDDENSLVDVGSIRLVNGITGKQSGDSLLGNTALDLAEAKVIESVSHKYYILSLKLADNNGRVDSGLVQLIAE